MKNFYTNKILLLLTTAFLLSTYTTEAKNYYLSATGNNSNNGLTPATAWQTIAKLNTAFTSMAAGDSILFKKGDTFYGSVIVKKSGTAALPIVFSSYGTGATPVISGFTAVTGWTNSGNGIWKKSVPAASNGLIVVAIDNKLVRLGRFPNADATNGGYLTYTSFSATAPSITGAVQANNWTGAEVAIRKNHWIIDRCKVTGMNGGTVNYTNPTGSDYAGKEGYGYFFQNDIRTLDQFGEWYLDKKTKDLSVYFGSNAPTNYSVKCSTVDTLMNMGSMSYITVQNLSFEGANMKGVYARFGSAIAVKNCTVNNCYDGIILKGILSSVTTQYDTLRNILNNGIEQSTTSSATSVIAHHDIKNISLFAGMGGSGDATYNGIIQPAGSATTLEYNRLDSCGYIPITFGGNNTNVRYNYVSNFCFVKDDGAGLYTGNGFTNTVQSNRVVYNNIIVNGIGAINGTPNFTKPGSTYDAHGIYLDAQSNNVNVHDNVVYNLANGVGVFINVSKDIQISNNTFYNVTKGLRIDRMPEFQLIRNIVFTSNIVYPTVSNFIYWNGALNTPATVTIQQDVRNMFTRIDSNYYRSNVAAPFDYFYHMTNGGTYVDPAALNMGSWKTFINHETKSRSISTNPIRFECNATSVAKNISLDATYMGVDSTMYNGTITLAPFTAEVLVKAGAATANTAPKADAGNNITITLPAKSTSLTGKGTDANGTIASYTWAKIAGPSAGTIVTASAATTAVNNLVQGVYKFELTVTDNNGATAKDTVQVTVNAAVIILPLANAGIDIEMTSPANKTNLTGSGIATDGKIIAYSWIKISGPVSGKIAMADSATTLVSKMVEGVYKFELTVTNDKGRVAKDTVVVTVNKVLRHAPVAKAGHNMTVTLPVSSITLAGSGSVAEGTIVSTTWTKVSGPVSGTILTANAATTMVNNLVQGVYKFELAATDNSGATGRDTIEVTVNAAANLLTNMLVNSNIKNELKVYPNPVRDITNLDITTASKNKITITVVDMNGKVVKSSEVASLNNSKIVKLDMSGLHDGYYVITVRFNDGQALSTKVVKIGGK